MRAVVFDRVGPPEVLRVADLPRPVAGPGEVLVRVRAAGVQPFDTLVRSGAMPVPVTAPQQLGNEFAGVVEDGGPGTTWATGDEVIGWAHMRSLAEFVVAGAGDVVGRPPGLPWEQAGGLGASGQTALTALADLGVGPGDTLLIQGGAGGVGSMAVQIACHRGARVLATASPANHDHVAGLGGVPVASGDGVEGRMTAAAPDGVTAALDAVGGEALRQCVRLVGDPGRVATLVDHALAEELGAVWVRARRSAEQLAELVVLQRGGALRVVLRTVLPLKEIVAAHRLVESGHGHGKVVMVLDDPDDPDDPDHLDDGAAGPGVAAT